MLREPHQTSLDGRWATRVDHDAPDFAPFRLQRRPQLSTSLIITNQTDDRNFRFQPSETRGDVSRPAGTTVNGGLTVDREHRHWRIWTEPLGGTTDHLIEHEITDQQEPTALEASHGLNEFDAWIDCRLVGGFGHD